MNDNQSILFPTLGNSEIIEARPTDLAELDAERYEADCLVRRGYDVDDTAPSHADFLARTRPANGDDR